MKRSLYSNTLAKTTLAPALVASTATGVTVDRMLSAEQFRSAMLVLNVGVVTDGTHTFKLQDSPNDSDWTDVAAGYLQGSIAAITSANDEALYSMGYTGSERYLRAVSTVTGSPSTGGLYSAVILMSGHSTPIR